MKSLFSAILLLSRAGIDISNGMSPTAVNVFFAVHSRSAQQAVFAIYESEQTRVGLLQKQNAPDFSGAFCFLSGG
ncbi:MAG: hypothetical protein ACR5LC_03845 [Symbiopectobacterium sp.]